ncbi:MAG: IS91 family transposase [Anaerolineales bacterium]|nr:IS91 family transposase [Anaerolineales bacterium]
MTHSNHALLEKSKHPRFDVADIFRKHIGEYEKTHRLSYEQRQAVSAIISCRTPALGGVLNLCDNNNCRHWDFCYKACKDRHCPKCGAFEKAQWLEAQKIWLLPIPYFHVVFTIDHIFNPLVWRNQEALYNLLIRIAALILKEYGRRYLGGEIGFTLVLHTWGQTMTEHPHLHFIVTGGALVTTPNGYRWQPSKRKFLFDAPQLSKDFRRMFCEGLRQMWQAGSLDTNEGQLDVAQMLAEAEKKNWEVFIQPPLYGVEKLLEYLGRYVFRIAISNHRIVSVTRTTVTFTYYDNHDKSKIKPLKKMTLSTMEFMRRFLLHVLPNHFVRIRHFGLHHGSCRKKLQIARRLLGLPAELPVIAKLKLLDWLKKILKTEEDPRLCPVCRKGIMRPVREFGPISGWRANLLSIIGLFARWKVAVA